MTEADHLSEALILDAIRARYPATRSSPRRPASTAPIAGEAPTSGRGRVWIVDPLDGTVNYANGIPSSASRSGSSSTAADGRRRPRPDARRDVRRRGGRPGDARTGARRMPRTRTSCPTSSISMALNGRTARQPGAQRPQGDPDLALDGLGGAGPRLRRATAGSMPSSSRAGCRPGTSRPRVSSPSAAARRSPRWTAGRGSTSRHAPKSIGILAAPPAHHAALLELVR